MLSLLRNLFQHHNRNNSSQATRSFRRCLEIECLEDRRLMSVGGAFAVATSLRPTLQSANASSANGMSVAVWTVKNSASDTNIMAQMFKADHTMLGNPIAVATTARKEHDPAVAMDAQGNFVVVWTVDMSATDQNIRGRLFSSEGATQGSVLTVASRTTRREYDPSVAMDSAGNFVVSYTLEFGGNGNLNVRGRRFNSDGTNDGNDFGVATSATANEFASSVARTDDGRFDIAYQIGENIELRRFRADGFNFGLATIANSSRSERNPSVAMDAAGNSIVAWQVKMNNGNWDIKARRIIGTAGDTVLAVAAATTEGETNPAIALSRDGQRFVVAYQSSQLLGDQLGAQHVKIREFRRENEVDVRNGIFDLGLGLAAPSVSIAGVNQDGNYDYLVTYTNFTPQFKVTGRFGELVA